MTENRMNEADHFEFFDKNEKFVGFLDIESKKLLSCGAYLISKRPIYDIKASTIKIVDKIGNILAITENNKYELLANSNTQLGMTWTEIHKIESQIMPSN